MDGLTQKDLTRMSSDPNTVASLLERMESAGLLTRKIDDQDRRARKNHAFSRWKKAVSSGPSDCSGLQS